MKQKTQRRLSAVVGAFLLLTSTASVALIPGALLDSPLFAVQVSALGVAGVLNLLAGFDTRVTERFGWYRLAGLGNVFLGLSLPFGFTGTTETLPLVLAVLGSLSIAGMGVDMLFFDGRHIYSEPLGASD
ncbi:MAG: hypothetical protein ACI9QA_000967 [Methanobacteriota archaeon]|jgi:hypothetical protein|uniref:SPW repeat-containing protein n=1 Tax=Halorutilus salinus TaxID=2487751 RepID=A0A9Q4GH61_9EURY|nr:hypothetical protein [Halorutilus salinus]MCX2819844.1 hypothetical protein [Halorutilus salinus]